MWYALAIYRVFSAFKNGDLTGLRSLAAELRWSLQKGRFCGLASLRQTENWFPEEEAS
jgi:hypothetical protein